MNEGLGFFVFTVMSVGATAGVGVTAHVTWHEFETRGKAFAMMQAPEKDPYYSEDHFGIVHKDFTPKAAYEALKRRKLRDL